MRFSLTTLLLVAFWIAAVMLVWVRREPWVLESTESKTFENEFFWEFCNSPAGSHSRVSIQAPDGTRQVVVRYGSGELYKIGDEKGSSNTYWNDRLPRGWKSRPIGFLNDDNMLFFSWPEQEAPGRDNVSFRFARRRHPEWWWGHFYRPEVWLALVLTGVLVWRGVRSRREASRA